MTETERLFVGNLPTNVNEQELKNEFSSYGSVKHVELKNKKNPDTEEVINTFAFVSIEIDDRSLKQCLQEFRDEKFKGRYLLVSVARENFLDKLKREREEASKTNGTIKNEANIKLSKEQITIPTLFNTKESSSDDCSSEESECEKEEPTTELNASNKFVKKYLSVADNKTEDFDNLILRKKSSAYLENGKIKIDAVSTGKAIHIIERNKKEIKNFDDKAKQADKKRLESLSKMKNTYNQQKFAIKQALAKVDTTKNNKIIFEDENIEQTREEPPRSKPLFDEDEEDDNNQDYGRDFEIKEQYQGERGGQLLKLQSRFKNDKRFDMDKRFLEDEDGSVKPPIEGEVAENDERAWQFGILENVLGKKLQNAPPGKDKNRIPQAMLRYDPTKEDHAQYVAPNKRKIKQDLEKVNSKKHKITEEAMEVSKEQFYKVSENLTTSLQNQSTGFSLLGMFGRDEDQVQPTPKQNMYKETLLNKNTRKMVSDTSNPFKYDSSDEEEEKTIKKPVFEKQINSNKNNAKKNSKRSEVWHESFFVTTGDERLNEGISFFMPLERLDDDEQDKAHRQKEMRNILRKKVKRSIKSLLPHGAKPNRNFRKFARNL